MPTIKLTDTAIDKILAPETGTDWYIDTELRGFQLAVGKRTKTFYAIKGLNGRNVRKKLGQHPFVRARAAREAALGVFGQISQGIDPRRKRSDTLNGVLADYIDRYTHRSHRRLSENTARQYRRVLELHCAKWLDRDLALWTKADISKLHHELRDKPYTANQLLRVLRMMFKHGIENRGYEFIDPTRGVRFFPEHKRVSKIDDWAKWYKEVQALPLGRRHYYLLGALTGIRRSNLSALEWSRVDLSAKTVMLINTKNKSTPTLPLSDYACSLLGELYGLDSRWVFPANSSSGHLEEPKDAVRGRVHDLRRMFTTAAARCHLPEYLIAKLRGDIVEQTVVQGYMGDISDHAAVEAIAKQLRSAWLDQKAVDNASEP